MDREPRVKVGVRLSRAALAQVDDLARADNRTRSDMLRILLGAGLRARAGQPATQPVTEGRRGRGTP